MSNSDVMQREVAKNLVHPEPFSTQGLESKDAMHTLSPSKRKEDERLAEYEAEDDVIGASR